VLLALGCLALCGGASGASNAHNETRASERAAGANVASEDREHTIKAAFLLNFIRYTTWPKSSFADAESPIRVMVVGKDPFGGVLESTFRGEKAGARSIEVTRSVEVPAEPVAHVVFCGELTRAERIRLLERCRQRAVLVIGEIEGFALEGAGINFYLQDQKTRFEINTDALAEAGLELSPAVLKLARIVRSRKESG
jgi:hypothetical protein